MKYSNEIVVDLPLAEFMEKFDNAENMKHWQTGLMSIEHLSGDPGMVGAKMKLKYQMEKKVVELIETVTHRNLPHEFHGTYSMDGMTSIQENYFEELPNGTTKWKSVSDFMPLNFMMRVMLWMMPGAFKKQSKKMMDNFKHFAEQGISVVDEKA